MPAEAPAATPLALHMAAAAGLDLSAVAPAGPDGRIRKADVDRVLAARRAASGAAAAPVVPSWPSASRTVAETPPDAARAKARPDAALAATPPGVAAPYRERPLTAMRRVTATRMQQAKQTVPHFYLRTECRVDAALGFLAAARRHAPDAAPTLTDLVVRAAACALRTAPQANAAWVDGGGAGL